MRNVSFEKPKDATETVLFSTKSRIDFKNCSFIDIKSDFLLQFILSHSTLENTNFRNLTSKYFALSLTHSSADLRNTIILEAMSKILRASTMSELKL
jgi:hypothetical protein